jgi:muramidase (phage lysozyme)
MKTKIAVLLGLLALLAAGAASARTSNAGEGEPVDAGGDSGGNAWDEFTADPLAYWTNHNIFETEGNTMPYIPSDPGAQLAAFRNTISVSEGTNRGDPYRVCYGYAHTIQSFADHPAVTREWTGEVLSDKMCSLAGFGPGCVSTAAGKYQITKTTWLHLKSRLGLRDFSPESQDAACDQLLRECGAYGKIVAGDLAGAVEAARKTWASLPNAGYGQGERTLAWIKDKFTSLGGLLA